MIRFGRNVFAHLVSFSLMAFLFIPAAGAQTRTSSPVDDGWHVSFSPYLWFAGIHGTVGAAGQEASVHASFSDVFSQLNIGLMTAAETRHNRIVIPVDFIWMNLSDETTLPAGPVASINADMTQVILTTKVGYRFVDSGRVKFDALFGMRYWHMGTTLTSQPGGLAPSDSANWVDALAGARMQAKLTPKFGITVVGDIGGGGANSDYQAAGLLAYELNRKWGLSAGYRYMAVNYRPNTAAAFVDDTVTSGVIAGVTWTIK